MTIYVVDEAHPVPPTRGNNEDAVRLSGGDTLILSERAEISASGSGASGISASGPVTLLLNGSVRSTQAHAVLAGGTISIAASGALWGGAAGLYLQSIQSDAQNVVFNDGSIYGADIGIFVEASHTTINNTGSISGSGGIWLSPSDSPTASLVVHNSGTIVGTSEYAISGSARGTNIIVNSGKIQGSVFLGGANDVYDGRGGTITGGLIYLSGGNDLAYGGAGTEKFILEIGTHVVDGGEGVDSVFYRHQVTVDLSITEQQSTGAGSTDTLRNIENVYGSNFQDNIAGNDDMNLLAGGSGDDVLNGRGGDDLLIGGSGSDTMIGGDGTDVAKFSFDFATYDIKRQSDGSYTISFGNEIDTLRGIEFAQFADRTIALTSATNSAPTSIGLDATTVDGRARAGALVGHLSGVDPDGDPLGYFLATNPGDHFRIQGDQLLVDKIFEATDTDFDIVVRASDPKGASLDRHFTISVSHDGVMSLREEGSPQSALSVPGFVATGGKRADMLVGGDGNDRLDGRAGKDMLIGHNGNDAFVFSTRLGKGNVDRILDFVAGDDMIQLSARIFKGLGRGALSKDVFHVGAMAGDADDRIIYNAKTGALSYDADGSGREHAAIKFAVLSHKPHLSAADFLVV